MASIVVASAIGSLPVSCSKDIAQNNAIRADVRNQVLANPSLREITVKKDNVTWAGNLMEGFAVNTQDRAMGYAASQSGLSKCWFTTLQVKDGYDNLPPWKKYGPGFTSIEFAQFQNPNFSNYNCYQLPKAEVK